MRRMMRSKWALAQNTLNKTTVLLVLCGRGLHSTRYILEHLRSRSGPSTMRLLSVALAVSSVAALQPPARASAAAKANPAAVDVYSRATAASAARDVALYGLFGPSEAEKRAEQARGGVRSDDPYTPPRHRRDTRRRASTPSRKR